jgi:formylglycine-generating enzyme required for sulfatase activity
MRRSEQIKTLPAAAFALASNRFPGRAEMSEDVRGALANGMPSLTLRTGAVQIELVRIPPGEFMMGSPADEVGHAPNEAPMRRVHISKVFYLSRFEITQAQYRAIMGEMPSDAEGDTLPISQITYANALEFCRRLSISAKVEVGLPTEAQWEYACRAGTQTRYYSGSTEADLERVAWYSGNSEGKVHPVGQKQPNALGIYDMHGNVWEYCSDFIDDYATMTSADPVGRVTPRQGAMRGGGWMHGPEECRAATRLISDDMFGGAGFRVAVSVD